MNIFRYPEKLQGKIDEGKIHKKGNYNHFLLFLPEQISVVLKVCPCQLLHITKIENCNRI